MKKVYLFVIIMFLFLITTPLYAETPDIIVTDIINKMKTNLVKRPLSTKLTIVIKNGEQITAQMIAGSAQKQVSNTRKLLLVLLEPQTLRGVAYLLNDMDNGAKEQWVYFPYIDRVRKITDLGSNESFLGTDFTYADLSYIDTINDTFKYIGEEEIGGVKTYKIESIPKKQNYYYSRIVNWVAKDTYLLLRRDYYSPSNRLWKRELLENITDISGMLMPLKIRMLDLEHKTSTEININEVDSSSELPDEMFVPEQLKYSLKCPVWQKVCYLPEKQKEK